MKVRVASTVTAEALDPNAVFLHHLFRHLSVSLTMRRRIEAPPGLMNSTWLNVFDRTMIHCGKAETAIRRIIWIASR